MPKTNHARGFVGKRFHMGQREDVGFEVWSGHGDNHVSDKRIGAGSTLAYENSRDIARDRRGAKKYLTSRNRFHENAATKRLAQEGGSDEL